MKWTIQRSKWLRGEGSDYSKLLREDGKMCCIGQVCKLLKVPDDLMLDRCSADKIISRNPDLFDSLRMLVRYRNPGIKNAGYSNNLEWVRSAYAINDNTRLNDTERESKLKHLAHTNGHKFIFVD